MDYAIEEATFSVPETWVDRTMNVLQPDPDSPVKIVVTREDLDCTLEAFAERELKELTRRVPWFRAIESATRVVAGSPACAVRGTFKAGDVALYQHRVTLRAGGRFVTIAAVAHEEAAAACDARLEKLLSTVELRKGQ
jgi:hypothetical protein